MYIYIYMNLSEIRQNLKQGDVVIIWAQAPNFTVARICLAESYHELVN